ncbi:DUF6531 domain-containing protein [Amycolatopsis carbonis]|uniref:DUF6531 domain-containing protein n=1 Tax=Amycolatopsis carbonis TaxID=715471 RepID=A0A9Y2IQ04_9PSEU|nr:DUF6531 domain-containing protein [Amycolatopsis sp. 2-15]WIX83969.1 DUF6531 domain-containing protein [Amycolatopsis sp. 2-15]
MTRTAPTKRAPTDGPFGWGWTYSYNLSAATDAGSGTVTIRQEDGSQVAFVHTNGSYTGRAAV